MNYPFSSKIGLGTWRMGESDQSQKSELKAIEYALSIGYRLIDTAEMYAKGNAERLIGKALKNIGGNLRSSITIVSKVLPHHASKNGVITACEGSLKRLGCDYIDMYLLHWMGLYPFQETLEGLQLLKEKGLIKNHGVSNFDQAALKKWLETEKSMDLAEQNSTVTNQVYYALSARGAEFDLIPTLIERNISLMAYSPLGGGELAKHKGLQSIAKPLGLSAAQLALAWVIRQPNTVAIPKSVSISKIFDNWACTDLILSKDTLGDLDQLFAPPLAKVPLAVI